MRLIVRLRRIVVNCTPSARIAAIPVIRDNSIELPQWRSLIANFHLIVVLCHYLNTIIRQIRLCLFPDAHQHLSVLIQSRGISRGVAETT